MEAALFPDNAGAPLARVKITQASGSAPREQGAFMLVSPSSSCGTIGGGQLEFMAIEAARGLLASSRRSETLNVPLGPEIGQCCGGRVTLEITALSASETAQLIETHEAEKEAAPRIHIFGAGHVGRALAGVLAPLPWDIILTDSRAEELAKLPSWLANRVKIRLTALPEAEVKAGKAGDAYVILTHDHALDFLIAGAVLERGDATFAGMIGSATKRAKFEGWMRRHSKARADALTCPVGAAGKGDKRPEIIAAYAAVEIIGVLRMQEETCQTPARDRAIPA